MTTPRQHAQLLRELAEHVDFDPDDTSDPSHQLHSRALQAAAEIEGWRRPTVDEIGHIIAASASSRSAARAVLARFGGGGIEGLPDAETLAELIYTDAMLPAAHAAPQSACEPPTWKGGNSLMEDCARRCAQSVLARFGGGGA